MNDVLGDGKAGVTPANPSVPTCPIVTGSKQREPSFRPLQPHFSLMIKCGLCSTLSHTLARSDARRIDCKLYSAPPPQITWRNFHHFRLVPQTSIDCSRFERRSRTTNPRFFDPVDNLDTSNPRQNGASRFRIRLKFMSARKAGVAAEGSLVRVEKSACTHDLTFDEASPQPHPQPIDRPAMHLQPTTEGDHHS